MKVMVVSCLLATVLAGQVLASSYESSTYPVPVPTYPTAPPTYPTYPTPPPTYPMYPTPSPMYPAYPKQDSSEESSEEEGTYSSQHAEPYAFEYHVKDEPSYNSYGQQEAGNDKVVSGHYYVDLPDGRRQTVTYKDDGHGSGFVADVKYDNKAAADVNYLPPLPTPSYYPKPPAYTPYAPPSPVYPKY